MRKRLSGYSLTEMIAVLSITSVLAAGAIPAIEAMRHEAADIRARKDIRLLQTLSEKYYQEKCNYPQSLDTILRHARDPFTVGRKNYHYETGVLGNKPYFVIYTTGANHLREFSISDAQVVSAGDDVVGSNFPVAETADNPDTLTE